MGYYSSFALWLGG